MGDAADDLYEREIFALDNQKVCETHKLIYVDYGYGCPVCEDPDYPLEEIKHA